MGDSLSPDDVASAADLAELTTLVTDLRARLSAVEADNAQLRAQVAAGPGRADPAAAPLPPGPVDGAGAASGPMGRRAVIAGAAGLAAAGVAAVAAPQPAAADNGQAFVLGSTGNSATSPTGVAFIGEALPYGIGATDNGLTGYLDRSAVVGHATGNAFDVGVHGYGASGFTTGVWGESAQGYGGVFTSGGEDLAALSASNTSGYGFSVYGGRGALNLQGPTALMPDVPAGTVQAVRGAGSSLTTLWFAIQTNSGAVPTQWRKLAGPGTAGAFHLLPTPVRVYDSRPGTTPSQGPKTPLPEGNVARTIDLKVDGAVPSGATGALLTVLLVNAATGGGNMTVWSNARTKPVANTMVWGGSAGRFTATATTAVDALARVKVDASLQTNLVLDVVGYFQ